MKCDETIKVFGLAILSIALNAAIFFIVSSENRESDIPKEWNNWEITVPQSPEVKAPEIVEPKIIRKPTDFEDAKKLSVEHKVPVVAVFVTDWCAACKLFKKTLVDPSVQTKLSEYIFVEVNAEKDPAVTTLNITSVPTTILLQPSGEITKRKIGFSGVEEFKQWLN